MAHYVEVPAAELFAKLEAAGFTRGISGREVTYTRTHAKDARLFVVVYTSVAEGAEQARAKDSDAIRAVAVFTWYHAASGEHRRKHLATHKVLRVTSVDGVLERTIDAARKAYAACNEFIKTNVRKGGHNV